jgi:DNA-binding response OmpR family regulator
MATSAVKRDQLMDHIKVYDWNPLDRGIDKLILRLRRKIERDPKN